MPIDQAERKHLVRLLSEMLDRVRYGVHDQDGTALRDAIRGVGMCLGQLCHLDEMLSIAEEAAGASDCYGARIDIIDKAWHGVSDKNGSTWLA